jgi:hypothetical protein
MSWQEIGIITCLCVMIVTLLIMAIKDHRP